MKTQHVYGAVIHCCHYAVQFFTFLFARHWMTGIANLAITAVIGLCLLRIGVFLRFSSQTLLRLRRIVLLVALIKGAFYFVMGESLYATPTHRWIVGVQFPYPGEALGLVAQTGYSIWHPTAISGVISLILTSVATVYLIARAVQLQSAAHDINTLQAIIPKNDRAEGILQQAAHTMAIRPARVPRLIVLGLPGKDLPVLSPLLLGIGHPFLLIPPQLLDLLTDAELDLVMRHELAHLVRRDHWWRWLLLWIVDVGAATVLAYAVRAAAVETEEQLCDRLAIKSSKEALLFARALQKMRDIMSDDAYPAASDGPKPRRASLLGAVTPLLAGNYASLWQYPSVIPARLKSLLAWSEELSAHITQNRQPFRTPATRSRPGLFSFCSVVLLGCGRLMVVLTLGIVLYAKYFMALNLQY